MNCEIFNRLAQSQNWERLFKHVSTCQSSFCTHMRTLKAEHTGSTAWVGQVIKEARELVDLLETFQCANTHERNRLRAQLISYLANIERGKDTEETHWMLVSYVSSSRMFLIDSLYHNSKTSGGAL